MPGTAHRCPCCYGWLSPSCPLCLGRPDENISIETLARGVAHVDRATAGTVTPTDVAGLLRW